MTNSADLGSAGPGLQGKEHWLIGDEISLQSIHFDRLAPVVFVISISLFLYIIFFLSWSSLIQLQVTYGWTKSFFLAKDWSKQKFYKLYKCCGPSKKEEKERKEK